MVLFASYLRRVLHKTRLISPRINGPNNTLTNLLEKKINCYLKIRHGETECEQKKNITMMMRKVLTNFLAFCLANG